MAALWEKGGRRLSSRLLYPEAPAAPAAAGLRRLIAAGALPAVTSKLERLWIELDDMELTPEIRRPC